MNIQILTKLDDMRAIKSDCFPRNALANTMIMILILKISRNKDLKHFLESLSFTF